ncbi:MAG: GNAT family protein [Alphaproteobacteria bacterium]|nr:GNAT family protein [Alphaproteobacteria bacterium]
MDIVKAEFGHRPETTLVGNKARLIPFESHHANDPSYIGWLRDSGVVSTLNLPRYLSGAVTDDEIVSYCRAKIADPDTLFFALVAKDGGFAGTVKAGPIDRYAAIADVGIMIGRKELWGQGLAYEMLGLLCHHLFEQESLRRLTAGSMAINPAMIRVFEKLGFKREGLFREQDRLGDAYVDHVHLGCLKAEFVPFRSTSN